MEEADMEGEWLDYIAQNFYVLINHGVKMAFIYSFYVYFVYLLAVLKALCIPNCTLLSSGKLIYVLLGGGDIYVNSGSVTVSFSFPVYVTVGKASLLHILQ